MFNFKFANFKNFKLFPVPIKPCFASDTNNLTKCFHPYSNADDVDDDTQDTN